MACVLFQLERELSTCTYLSVSETTLYLRSSQNNSVTIDRINRVLRKRDNNGYQPLLTEVTDVSFEKIGAAIRFTVSFENGEQKMDNGKFTHKRRHKGGILLTALLFVQLLSLMLLLVLENSRTTALFIQKPLKPMKPAS